MQRFLFPQISHLSCDQRLVDYMWLITRRRLFQSLRCGWSFPKLNSLKGCVGEYGGLLRVYALIRCNILRYFTNPIFFRIIYGSTSPKPYRNYYSCFRKKWWVSGLLIFFVVLKESRGLFSCNEILHAGFKLDVIVKYRRQFWALIFFFFAKVLSLICVSVPEPI